MVTYVLRNEYSARVYGVFGTVEEAQDEAERLASLRGTQFSRERSRRGGPTHLAETRWRVFHEDGIKQWRANIGRHRWTVSEHQFDVDAVLAKRQKV